MLPEWIGELNQAAVEVDSDRILQLIEEIPATHPHLAAGLTDLVRSFCKDIIRLSWILVGGEIAKFCCKLPVSGFPDFMSAGVTHCCKFSSITGLHTETEIPSLI